MPYSVPIIALASQHLHWKAVPCHFNSTSILCSYYTNTMIFVRTSKYDGSPESQLDVNSNHISSNRKCFSGKMKFSYCISVILVELELESCPVDSKICDFPHHSHYQCFHCNVEQNFNVTGTELAVCSCVCRLSIPALQDEVGERKLRHTENTADPVPVFHAHDDYLHHLCCTTIMWGCCVRTSSYH